MVVLLLLNYLTIDSERIEQDDDFVVKEAVRTVSEQGTTDIDSIQYFGILNSRKRMIITSRKLLHRLSHPQQNLRIRRHPRINRNHAFVSAVSDLES